MTIRIEAVSVHDGLLAVDVLLNGTARNSIDFVVMALPPQAMIDGVIGVNFLRPYRVTFDFIEEWVEFDDRS